MTKGITFNPQLTEYKLPQNFGLNVGGVNRGLPSNGAGRTQYVEGEKGDQILYANANGHVGVMGSPSVADQAGYHHTRPPREICVA